MKQLGEALDIALSSTPVQYETTWDIEANILTILVNKGPKK